MSRLERWSRRKRGEDTAPDPNDTTANEAIGDESGDEEHTPAPPPVDAAPEHIEEGSLDAELPDPDTLAPEDNFKSFLLPGVSPELKRRALRRMFTASHYNVRDGLDDYDLDYTQMRTISEDVSAGLRHWMERLTDEETEPDDSSNASATADSSTAERDIAAVDTPTPDAENDTAAKDDEASDSGPDRPQDRSV